MVMSLTSGLGGELISVHGCLTVSRFRKQTKRPLHLQHASAQMFREVHFVRFMLFQKLVVEAYRIFIDRLGFGLRLHDKRHTLSLHCPIMSSSLTTPRSSGTMDENRFPESGWMEELPLLMRRRSVGALV